MLSVTDANISAGLRIFVRGDLDVPLAGGNIVDTFRLDRLLPTLNFLKSKSAEIILAGHIGRPHGSFTSDLSTKQLKNYFDEKLGNFSFELMENLRFDLREETNDVSFARELASKANLYVNECFGTNHERHASIVGLPKLLPAYAGVRLMEEVATLGKVMREPARPLTVILGGAKIDTKLPVISKFVEFADNVLLGGKLGLEWKGGDAKNLYTPTDYAIDFKDIGPNTIAKYKDIILASKTIIWSGPMGVFEEAAFFGGTLAIATAVIAAQAYTIAGGGDTISALKKANALEKFGFVSTGGSAMLEFLARGRLPGLEALEYHG